MYVIGSPGTQKTDSLRVLEKLLSNGERLVTDAEVLQEILHRYSAINRHHDIQRAFDALLTAVDEVLSIDRAITERAKHIVLSYRELSARDAIHLAVMQQHNIEKIFSFDRGFDVYPGVTRIP